MPQSNERRRFILDGLVSSLGAFLAMVIYPTVRFIVQPPVARSNQSSVVAVKVDDLKPNDAKLFPFVNKAIILMSMPGGEHRALSAV